VSVGEQKKAGESPIMRDLIISFLRRSNEGEYYRQDQVQVTETAINTQFQWENLGRNKYEDYV